MIGKIYTSVVPFYDVATGKKKFKTRPVLIIGGPRNNDYNVLPVSTVSKRANLDSVYDYEIDPTQYPNTNLDRTSYIRVHKQTTVHYSEVRKMVCDLKTEYEDIYLEILTLLEQYNGEITDNALL